ncbi:hypothetical protein [Comamonas faecalis]
MVNSSKKKMKPSKPLPYGHGKRLVKRWKPAGTGRARMIWIAAQYQQEA